LTAHSSSIHFAVAAILSPADGASRSEAEYATEGREIITPSSRLAYGKLFSTRICYVAQM